MQSFSNINNFLISEINFWYQKIISWYQKISIKVLFGIPYTCEFAYQSFQGQTLIQNNNDLAKDYHPE